VGYGSGIAEVLRGDYPQGSHHVQRPGPVAVDSHPDLRRCESKSSSGPVLGIITRIQFYSIERLKENKDENLPE
jgi:hypothetical protein